MVKEHLMMKEDDYCYLRDREKFEKN